MKNLSKNDKIRAYDLADQITKAYDYIDFSDAWQDAKLFTTMEIFEAAYEEAENIWSNQEVDF
jgi:hypothetical protein